MTAAVGLNCRLIVGFKMTAAGNTIISLKLNLTAAVILDTTISLQLSPTAAVILNTTISLN
jgi:hypothetical protein